MNKSYVLSLLRYLLAYFTEKLSFIVNDRTFRQKLIEIQTTEPHKIKLRYILLLAIYVGNISYKEHFYEKSHFQPGNNFQIKIYLNEILYII